MSTPPFGSVKCYHCKGTAIDPHLDRDCDICRGQGWLTPERRRELAARPTGEEVVKKASDAIVPIVHDNPFSQEALSKVMRSGRDKSMRRTVLSDLYAVWPSGMSSSQFEERYDWLHQSCSAALTGLHQEGILSVVEWRSNKRGNREGVYSLSAMAHSAWESV